MTVGEIKGYLRQIMITKGLSEKEIEAVELAELAVETVNQLEKVRQKLKENGTDPNTGF